MQQETIAKTLTELFMLLARIGKDGEPPSDSESPAQIREQTFEQTVGECPSCSAFVEADEIVENPLGLTIYFGDCSRCRLPVMWIPEVLVSIARTPDGELIASNGDTEETTELAGGNEEEEA